MIRVVLDTNILVSALLQAQGLPARIFLITLAGTTTQLSVSGDVDAEYEEVIRRPEFNRDKAVIESALRAIRQNGFWVKPSEKVRACTDPDDDIFLECAQAARAHYLVTGNIKHFPPKWADTQIVTARQFLDAVARGIPLQDPGTIRRPWLDRCKLWPPAPRIPGELFKSFSDAPG